jgi:hypothetical protein
MNNLGAFFEKFNLRLVEKYPEDSKIYLYADYFELVSLFNNETIITVSEMLVRLKNEGIIKQSENIDSKAKRNDEDETFVRNVFILLSQRSSSFNKNYPFNVLEEELSIKGNLTSKQKMYIFLLLASNLNLFRDFQSTLTSEFEIMSKEALKNYLPDFAIVKMFGKNSEFNGLACEKVRHLAEAMNLTVNEDYLQTVASGGTQDLGLDIVGWLPHNDSIGNHISVFGQCACGKDWNKKLTETRQYNRFLNHYLSEIQHSIFIPYSLINYQNSTFYEHHEFGEATLIFERQRILSLIKNDDIFNKFNSKALVEKSISYSEDIV